MRVVGRDYPYKRSDLSEIMVVEKRFTGRQRPRETKILGEMLGSARPGIVKPLGLTMYLYDYGRPTLLILALR